MNPIVVAQANGPQSGNSPSKVITVNKPSGEQAITIHLDGSTKLDLSAIASEQITLVHVGERLIILFDNHAQVTIDPFYSSENGQPAADLTIELGPGRDVTAAQFAGQFPITDDQAVLPTSGEPGAPSSGANFVGFTLDALSTPTPLDLLKPETFGGTFGSPDEVPHTSQNVPMSLTGAVINGGVDEGGMLTDTIHTVGNDPGAAFSATGVAGSLNALVNFGSGGPAGTPFQFVDTAAANAWLAGLGLELHGSLIDAATITGNTLVASTDPAQGTPHDVFSLTLNADGSWVFTLLSPLDHITGLGENTAAIDLSGLIQAVSAAGGHLTLSHDFTITVIDDVPVVASGAVACGSVDEGALFGKHSPGDLFGDGNDHYHASASISGSLSGLVKFGADGPASATLGFGDEGHETVTDGFHLAAATGAHDFGVTSHGLEVGYVTVTTFGTTEILTAFTGSTAGGNEVFTLALNGDGTYTFTLINPLDDAPGHGENSLTLDLSSLIKAVDFDGDSVALSGDFKITIVDDVPALVPCETSCGFVDEGGLDQKTYHGGTDLYGDGNDPHAPTVATGSLAGLVRFGADGAESGTFTATYTDSHHHEHGLTQTIADGFHFVSVAAAEAWLTGLNGGQGFTSHGDKIDVVTLTSATSTNGTTVSDVETLAAWTDGGPSHGGHEVFTLSLNVTTGAWTFTLINPVDHAHPGEDVTQLDLSGLVQAIDFDHDAVTLTAGDFTIAVKDDVPELVCDENSYGKVDEGALERSNHVGDLYGDGNDQGRCDFATATACGSLCDLVSFGADGPAAKAFQFVTQAAAATWLADLGLKSHGDLIDTATISTDSHGNLVLTAGTDQGDHHGVFTLTLDQDSGQWVFTLLNPLDQSIDNGENSKTIDLSGLVQAVDFDGDKVTLANDFSITVVDDVPELTCNSTSGKVDEGALHASATTGDLYGSGNDVGVSGAALTASGTFAGLVAFGADGPNATADYRFVSQSAAAHWLDKLNLTSHGSDVDNVTIANQGGGVFLLTAIADDGHAVFTLALNQSTGAWTFTLLNPIDHSPDHGENSTALDLSGLIQGVDFDGDAVTLSDDFTIKIVDDVPTLAAGKSSGGAVDEGGLTGSTHGGDLFGSGTDHSASVTATGSLSGFVNFGADGPDTGTISVNHHNTVVNTGYQFVSEHTAESWLASLNNGHGLTSHGDKIDEADVSVVNGIATLTASTDDHDVFTLQLNETTGQWTFTLINPIDHPAGNSDNTISVNLSGLVEGVDFDGDAVSLSSGFSVIVIDDTPVQMTNKSTSGTVDEDCLTGGSLGDLYGSGTGHNAITGSGSLAQLVSFGADGAQSGTFSATFTDSHGHHTSVVDTIATGFQLVGGTAAGSWLAGLGLKSHGEAINFATVTSSVTAIDTHNVSDVETLTAWTKGGPSNGGHEVFTLTLDVTTGAWTFTLINPIDDANGGGQNSATFDLSGLVQAVDFDHDATTLSGHFSVTVTDDVPTASHVDAAAVLESASASVTLVAGHDYSFGADGAGSLTFDTAHAVITGPNGVTLGTPGFIVNGNTIEIDPGTAFLGLAAGQSATVDVTYKVTDFDGDTTTSDVKFTFNGVNPASTITTHDLKIAVDQHTGNADDPHAAHGSFSIPVLSLLFGDSSSTGHPLTITAISGDASWGVTNGHQDTNYIQVPLHGQGNTDTFTITVSDGVTTKTQTIEIDTVSFDSALTNHGNGNNKVYDASNGYDFVIDNRDQGNNLDSPSGNHVLIENNGGANLYGGTSGNPPTGGGNNLLIGSDLAGDNLFAGTGNDTLWGRGGSDNLFGNTTANKTTTFYYASASEGGDNIFNFDSASGQNDGIAVSKAGFNLSLAVGSDANSIFESSSSNAFTNSADRFHFDTANHTLYYSANGTTASEIVLATVTNATVHGSDIHIVA